MPRLSDDETKDLLKREPAWKLEDGRLVRDWKFRDFVAAMEFVNRIATMAEAADHHPDIDIRYNQVRLGLVSHDAGGITDRDAKMVANLSKAFADLH